MKVSELIEKLKGNEDLEVLVQCSCGCDSPIKLIIDEELEIGDFAPNSTSSTIFSDNYYEPKDKTGTFKAIVLR